MNINFKMWKTALWALVKMDKKEEWDRLDIISKWLIATRSAVTTVTLYACVIGGLAGLAGRIISHGCPGSLSRSGCSLPMGRTTC